MDGVRQTKSAAMGLSGESGASDPYEFTFVRAQDVT